MIQWGKKIKRIIKGNKIKIIPETKVSIYQLNVFQMCDFIHKILVTDGKIPKQFNVSYSIN